MRWIKGFNWVLVAANLVLYAAEIGTVQKREVPYKPELVVRSVSTPAHKSALAVPFAAAAGITTSTSVSIPRSTTTTTVLASRAVVSPTTTTTTSVPAPTVLSVARAELGKAGSYAQDGFWCAKFVSFVATEAQVPGFVGSDSPSRLYFQAKDDGRLTDNPVIGGLAFIDLQGNNNAENYITHVAIPESVDGDAVTVIQGNGAPDARVVTRATYHLHDGYLIDFAPFAKS
jgi:hypothetical protein